MPPEQPSRLELRAAEIIRDTQFQGATETARATFYGKQLRFIEYSGTYQGKPALLKVYDDPRTTDEPYQLDFFGKQNTSDRLAAPAVYKYEINSPTTGWYICEPLPEGKMFKHPFAPEQRADFLGVYKEYREHFPKEPNRPLQLPETLPAPDFYLYRIHNWMKSAHDELVAAQIQGEEIVAPQELSRRLLQAKEMLNGALKDQPMRWSYGLFKGGEVFKANDEKNYLINFERTHMAPEGYEFGIMIWADQLMTMNAQSNAASILKAIEDWKKDIAPVAEQIGIQNSDALIRATLAERLMGMIFADVVGNKAMPLEEKKQRLPVLFEVFDALAA